MTVSIIHYAQFINNAVGATGLTVTVDVDRYTRSSAARSQIVTAGSAIEGTNGVYFYNIAAADLTLYDYVVVFKTSGTADQKNIPSMWSSFSLDNTAPIAAIPTTPAPTAAAVRTEMDANSIKLANLDATITSRSNYAGTDTPGTTTLLSRLTSGRATNLDNLDAAISGIAAAVWGYATRLLSSVTAIVNGIWDEPMAGHTIATTTGGHLDAAGGAGDPLLNPVPGSYASGTAGAVLGALTSQAITFVNPVINGGIIKLVYGDDYYAVDGRSLDIPCAPCPDLTGATISFKARGASLVTVTGTVLSASSVRIELAAANVMAIGAEVAPYDISAVLLNGHTVTLVSGSCVVSGDVR